MYEVSLMSYKDSDLGRSHKIKELFQYRLIKDRDFSSSKNIEGVQLISDLRSGKLECANVRINPKSISFKQRSYVLPEKCKEYVYNIVSTVESLSDGCFIEKKDAHTFILGFEEFIIPMIFILKYVNTPSGVMEIESHVLFGGANHFISNVHSLNRFIICKESDTLYSFKAYIRGGGYCTCFEIKKSGGMLFIEDRPVTVFSKDSYEAEYTMWRFMNND